MSQTKVNQNIRVKRKKQTFLSSNFVIAILVLILLIALAVIVSIVNRPRFLTISGFNWLQDDITVSASGSEVSAETLREFSLNIDNKGETIVTIKDSSDRVIRENKYDTQNKNGLILELVSSVQENQCVIKTDVTDIYYKINEDFILGDFQTLSDKAVTSYFYEFDPQNTNTNFIVYPGRYNKEKLPDQIPEGQNVEGIFFVDCNNIKDKTKLRADILGSVYFEKN